MILSKCVHVQDRGKDRGWNIFSEIGALNDCVSSIPIYSGNPLPTVKPEPIQDNGFWISVICSYGRQTKQTAINWNMT